MGKKVVLNKMFIIEMDVVLSIIDLVALHYDNNRVITQANEKRSYKNYKHVLK